MKRYKFRMSETNWIEFTEKDLNEFQNVGYYDGGKGKIIPVTRTFDKQNYKLLVPIEMIEEIKDDN